MARRVPGEAGRAALAMRGVALVALLTAAAIGSLAVGGGVVEPGATVSAALPASAGTVRENSPVQYRGVVVGRLAGVDGDIEGTRLTLRLEPDLLREVPANVAVRLLPRTVFGDQYLDLAVPRGTQPHGSLAPGAHLPADESRRTIALYDAYTRLYELIDDLDPARLKVALTTVADTLRGRGAEIGELIDRAGEVARDASPLLDELGEDITTVAALARDLSAATPELLRSLDDAVALSRTVVAERESISAVLSAGIDLSGTSQRFLLDNTDRFIELARATGPLSQAMSRHRGALSDTLAAADFFLDGAKRTFATGVFNIEAGLTLDHPYPYTAADCPRYPGMAGPNCGDTPDEAGPPLPLPGGTAGPVGSEQEQRRLRELAPLLPDSSQDRRDGERESTPDESGDLLSLLLGPMLRGNRVVVP